MFKREAINFYVLLISISLLVVEILHSYYLLRVVQSVIKENSALKISELIYIVLLTLLVPICAYFQTLFSQTHAISLRRVTSLDFGTVKPFQAYVDYIQTYMISSPLELNNRIGLGVVSTANYLTARLMIIIVLLIVLIYRHPEFALIISTVSVPIVIALLFIKKIQKFFGSKMSTWINLTPEYISNIMVELIRGKKKPANIRKKIEFRVKQFARYLSVSQAASNSIKPFVETLVIVTILFIIPGDGLLDLTDPISLAALYRVYSNGVTAISQYSLIQSSLPALQSFVHKQSGEQFQANEELVDRVIEGNCVEIRGRSGVGKSTLLEYVAVHLLKKDKCCYYLSAEFLPLKITVKELHSNLPRQFPNLTDVGETTKIESLSLGQKKALLLELAATLEDGYVLIDEPFSNLDAECAKLARSLLANLKANVIITNHENPVEEFKQVFM